VIDLSVMIPGAYLTRLLAQYGADVIKVEHLPHGDPTRELKQTGVFELLNQGKRSIGINLKTEEGVALVRRLAGEADLFVENFREGVMDSFGLGYAELSEDNPDLVYLSVRGLTGNNASRAAHDNNFIATSGCGEWFLESGVPDYSTQWGDIIGGALVPAIRLLLHLSNPVRGGMHIITSVDEAFRAVYLPRAFDSVHAETIPENERKNYGLQNLVGGKEPHTRYYRCRDGQWIALSAVQPKHWNTFCEIVDRKPWKTRQHDAALIPELEKLFQDAPSTYWEALVTNKEACLFRVIPWGEHLTFSQARPQLTNDPFAWAGFAAQPSIRAAPLLGADTYSVMHTLGLDNKEIAELTKKGVISGAEVEQKRAKTK
jgi:alpha-methylacyl-CoA racemase